MVRAIDIHVYHVFTSVVRALRSHIECILQETHGSGLGFDGMEDYVAELLAASHEFMRKQEVNSEIK